MKFTDLIRKFFGGIIVFCFVLLAGFVLMQMHQDAQAQIQIRRATPEVWVDYSGTNWVGFGTNADMTIRSAGTSYSGITTNFQMYGGATNSMRLVIVKGLIVGVTAY